MLDFLSQAPHFIADVTATVIDGLDGVDIEACRFCRATWREVPPPYAKTWLVERLMCGLRS